jgi:hypothetical protein
MLVVPENPARGFYYFFIYSGSKPTFSLECVIQWMWALKKVLPPFLGKCREIPVLVVFNKSFNDRLE